MEQNLRQLRKQYHDLFDGGRCSGWESEQHFVRAIKSGKLSGKQNPRLQLSGHRLDRFGANLEHATDYLNQRTAYFISVPYGKFEDDSGRFHIYCLCYVDYYILAEIDSQNWRKHGAQYRNENQ